MPSRSLITAILFALGLTGAAAGENMLGGNQIKSLIAGKTVFLSTGYGFNMPLHYGGDGDVTGDGSGTLLGKYFAPKETGKWWVDDDRLCQQWPSWYDGRTFCFTVRKTGAQTIHWRRDDGYSGTARISG